MNEELQRLLSLQDELIATVSRMVSSGSELSDELQGFIAEQLSWLQDRIMQLQGDVNSLPPNTPPTNLEPGPFPSSNVNSFKYNPQTGQLFVKFHGKDSADSGPIYSYENVPKNIYDVFSKGRVAPKTSGQNQYHRWIKGVTPSLGASLYALIRNGGFPYQRLS